ncbi:MAG: GNAT family N-acetyltransferase [Anaerolineales bacterium]|nr:GNAT family N-acetyltransferase [Anaerolineales bacterium]
MHQNYQNPDVHLRPFEGDHDFALIASIEQRCLHADRVLRVPTRDWIAHTYSGLRNFDPHRDVQIAMLADKPVGYVRMNWEHEPGIRISLRHQSFILPQQRQTGVSEQLLAYAEERLMPLGSARALDESAYLTSGAYDSEVEKWGLLERAGYRVETTFHDMAYDLKQIESVPADLSGFAVRAVQSTDLHALWELVCEHGEGDGCEHPAGFLLWRQDPRFQPEVWRALFHNDLMIGCALGHIHHQENRTLGRRWAYIDQLVFRSKWRNAELTSLLLSTTLAGLKQCGIRKAVCRVERDSGECGRRYLQQHGFHTIKRFSLYQKSLN